MSGLTIKFTFVFDVEITTTLTLDIHPLMTGENSQRHLDEKASTPWNHTSLRRLRASHRTLEADLRARSLLNEAQRAVS